MSTLSAPNSSAAADVVNSNDSAAGNSNSDPEKVAAAAVNQNTDVPADLIVICGETTTGNKFRPSDWCERLQGALRVLGDEADDVAECVQVVNYQGQKCILVQTQLEAIREEVYRFFMNFAADNKLKKVNLSFAQWDAHYS